MGTSSRDGRAIGVMALAGGSMFVFFARKGWFR